MQKTAIIIFVMFLANAACGQTIEKFSIDNGGVSINTGGIDVLYTIGEVNLQEWSVGAIELSEGFINPFGHDTCLGDANLDGTVDVLDLISVSSNFGCIFNCYGNGDANFDGDVNVVDLITISSNFGVVCP